MAAQTRAALLRFARVLERRGDDAGDAYVRASAAPPPYTGSDQEAALRTLIEAFDRRGEHDLLDALRPEVEKSYRVGDLFARALGKRGSLEALDSYVRAPAHHWEHCTRLDGGLSVLVERGEEGLRLVRAWLELPVRGSSGEAVSAHWWAQSRLAQAAAWLGDEASARGVMRKLETLVAGAKQLDAMLLVIELASLCAAMDEVPRATALLREADGAWDAIYDEDVDGYGRVPKNALNTARQRVQHLEAQGRLPLLQRTWAEPPVRRPYVPMWSSQNFWRAHRMYDLQDLLAAQKFDEALGFLEDPREGGEWASMVRLVADSLDTATFAQLDRLVAVHRRLPADGKKSVNWCAWSVAAVCGALSRSERADDAFALAAAVRDGNLTDQSHARLACAEGVISRRRSHPSTRPALEAVIAELGPRAAGDQTDVFTTPLSFAELLLPLA